MQQAKCRCGQNLKKLSRKNYWIEYYLQGKRKRERIGPSKLAAENRYREVLTARTEEKYIDKDKSSTMSLGELCKWYSQLTEVKSKKSYRRDIDFIKHLCRILGAATIIRNLTPGNIEEYRHKRLSENSPRRKGCRTKPATVNKEVSCLKTIFNRAIRHGVLKENPVAHVRRLPENNVRMRILEAEEFERLHQACSAHLKDVVLTAYYTGMRRSEIVNLSWDNVDLKNGFIRLTAEMTKTATARTIPLHPRVQKMLERLPRGIHTSRVFLLKGTPFNEIKRSFSSACRRAGIENLTFHDLRHCAINNMRLAGNDYFRIMAASGHKTTSVFKRYNLVTESELKQMKWLDEGSMDTNMDTNKKGLTAVKP